MRTVFYLCLCGVGAVVQLEEELSGPSTKQSWISPELREKLVRSGRLHPGKRGIGDGSDQMTLLVTPKLFILTQELLLFTSPVNWHYNDISRHHSYPFAFTNLLLTCWHTPLQTSLHKAHSVRAGNIKPHDLFFLYLWEELSGLVFAGHSHWVLSHSAGQELT